MHLIVAGCLQPGLLNICTNALMQGVSSNSCQIKKTALPAVQKAGIDWIFFYVSFTADSLINYKKYNLKAV